MICIVKWNIFLIFSYRAILEVLSSMPPLCHLRKIRGHSWLLLDLKLLETAIHLFDIVKWSILSIFTFIADQEVLHLLHVSIVSFKEAKRTFLTPDEIHTFIRCHIYISKVKTKHYVNFQIYSYSKCISFHSGFYCVIFGS